MIHKETPKAIRAGRKYLAYTLGGGTADATITLTLVDSFDQPVADYPRTSCELSFAEGNIEFCDERFFAEDDTDALGATTFTLRLR